MNPSLWDILIAFPMLVALVVLFAAILYAEFRDRRMGDWRDRRRRR